MKPTLEREEIPTLEEMIAEELSNADLPDEELERGGT